MKPQNLIWLRSEPLFIFLAFFLIFFNFCIIKNANADIYMKIGKNGTVYFSNVPVANNYKVYMITRNPSKKSNNFNNSYKYQKIIKKAAKKYNVNPHLIEAVIKTESGYNKTAVSDKGAEGLMQLMPDTQRMLDVTSPFNPMQNIYGGTRYLKSLLNRYNGNLSLALAAYNAGQKAVTQYGGIPPYNQTQNYVKKVMYYYKGK